MHGVYLCSPHVGSGSAASTSEEQSPSQSTAQLRAVGQCPSWRNSLAPTHGWWDDIESIVDHVTDQYHGGSGDFFDDQDDYRSSIYQAHVVEGDRYGGDDRGLAEGDRQCRLAREFMETSTKDLQDSVQPVRCPSWEIQHGPLSSQELIAEAPQPWYQRASMQQDAVDTTVDDQPGVAHTSEDNTESPRTIKLITTRLELRKDLTDTGASISATGIRSILHQLSD